MTTLPSEGSGGTPSKWARTNYFGVYNGLQLSDLSVSSPPPSKWAFFDANRVTHAADIHDGLSNTMCITEGLTGVGNDYRGVLWSDQECGAFVFTELGPNSPLDDRCYPWPDPANPGMSIWCPNYPDLNLPATSGDGSTTDPARPAAGTRAASTCSWRTARSGSSMTLSI